LQRRADAEGEEAEEVAEETRLDMLEGELAIDRSERTDEDARIGRELVQLAQRIDPSDREHHESLLYAVQLFGPEHVADLVGLLESDVWQNARQRLGHLKTQQATAAAAAFDNEVTQFIANVAAAIQQAGIEVTGTQGISLTVGRAPKMVHLNTPMWIGRRRLPGTLGDLLDDARQFLAQKR
jgi:hypothetical protein